MRRADCAGRLSGTDDRRLGGDAADILTTIAATEASRSRDSLDTHPRLAERAAALGVRPTLAPREGSAGWALLGGLWPTIAAGYNARWHKENAVTWSVAHMRYRLIEAPLLAAEAETVAGWPIARRIERAMALRKVEPTRGLAELAALHAAAADDRSIAFVRLGAADGGRRELRRDHALARQRGCELARARLRPDHAIL